MSLSLDSEKCTKCGACVETCIGDVFEQKEKLEAPVIVNESMCVQCAHCMMKCPVNAISVPGYSTDNVFPVGKLPEPKEVESLLLGRRSIRSFADKQVDKALLEKIVVLAASAPSAHNDHSTEFTIIQNPETLRLIEQYTAEGMKKMIKASNNPLMRPIFKRMMGNQYEAMLKILPLAELVVDPQKAERHLIFYNAPALIAFHGQPTKLQPNVNAQLCVQNALIASYGLGLGGLYAGFVTASAPRDKRLLELLKVPQSNELYAVVAVGYPKTKFNRYAQGNPPKITWS